MKKTLLKCMLLAFVAASCSQDYEEPMAPQELESMNAVAGPVSDQVTFMAASALASSQGKVTRSGKVAARLSCFANAKNDTLFYVIDNPDGGWTLYATDKRVSPVVASCDKGTFREALANDNLKAWLDFIGSRMAQIKKQTDANLNLSKAEIAANRDFWLSVEDPISYMYKSGAIKPPTLPKDSLKYYGHYELVSSTTEVVITDAIDRLTKTDWEQEYLTNAACPYKLNGENRCPAGCVAIAAGQMMYFLHSKYNIPAEIPSQAYCNSKWNEKPYDWAQTNYTIAVWDQIDRYGYNTAPLIADIGRRVNMQYGEEGSGAYTRDLKVNVFAPYGITCTVKDYNYSELIQSIQNKMPVILDMGQMENHNKRHAFICDRYRRSKSITTNTYKWVYDRYPENPDGSIMIVPVVKDRVETVQSLPYVTHIGFNWGLGAMFNNAQEWFSVSGAWAIPGMPDYRYNGYMIIDFKIAGLDLLN